MEFKGTKGKWEVEKAEIDSSGRGYIELLLGIYQIIQIYNTTPN